MPAVVADDITILPRIPAPDPAIARERAVRSVTTAPHGFEGEGFPVRRAFAGVALEDLDPFIHLDQMGEVEYAPGEPKGTPWHPHRGFETVTYMIDGVFEHSDSNGGGGVITNGDTQWMTAGAGILHIEKPPEQLVGAAACSTASSCGSTCRPHRSGHAPRYQDIRASEVALLSSPDGGALVRVIAGDVAGSRGSGLDLQPDDARARDAEPRCAPGAPVATRLQRARLRDGGDGTVGADAGNAAPVSTGRLAVLGPGDAITLSAASHQESRSPTLDVLILGGRPIREPVAWMGPFVMNTREEVMQAVSDYQAGRLGSIPAVHNAPTHLVETRAPHDR